MEQAEQQVRDAAEWLWSDDGLAAARAALRRARLPVSSPGGKGGGEGGREGVVAEYDLVTDAFLRFRERVARHGPLDELHVPAYLTRVMQHLVTDVLRARAAFPTDPLDADVPDVVVADLDDDDDAHTAALRNAIEAADASRRERAAALAFVTAIGHPDAVPDDVDAPRAKRGASEREQAMWHALWFSGRRDGIFPTDEHELSVAMRKARSRAGAAVRAVVERAALLVYREPGRDRMEGRADG